MQITTYDLKIRCDGCDTTGTGTITIDGQPAKVSWCTGGRDIDWTIEGREDGPSLEEFLSNWTAPFDAIIAVLKAHGRDDWDDYNARVWDGNVMWLISDNDVLVGTLQDAVIIDWKK